MRCRGCGYSLWNVPGRTCPECGESFRPSEFRFRPNAVEFCCPGCMQQYYGTGADGLLVPRAFACVRCGAACEVDAMVLRAAPGVGDGSVEQDEIAWESRARLGTRHALWRTFVMACGRPSDVGRALHERMDGGSAFRFLVAMVAASTAPTVLGIAGIGMAVTLFDRSGARGSGLGLLYDCGTIAGLAAMWMGGLLLGGVLAAYLAAGLGWVVMRVLGGTPRWDRTWGSFAYGVAPAGVMAVPVLVACFAWWGIGIWVLVAIACILAQAVREPWWRAAAAVAAPVLLAIAVGAVGTYLLVAPVGMLPSPTGTASPSTPGADASGGAVPADADPATDPAGGAAP